jgi:lycopene cyclase domain-containing protein
MTYTQISILAVLIAVTLDLFVIKTVLLKRAAFWSSYAIILPFQFLTNWWLTSRNIVMYDPDVITGVRFFSAPAEDVLFGFALILSVQSLWVNLGKSARSNRS